MNLTQKKLKQTFSYDDGNFYYLKRSGKMLPGSIAGVAGPRYYMIGIYRKTYRRHQLVWLFHKGYFPKLIDHIDGNSFNDRIENLRECTQHENTLNRKIDKRNKTGFRGVSISCSKDKPFMASINNPLGKRVNLGLYKTAEEASASFETAAKIFYNGKYTDRAITNSTEKVQKL